MSIATATVRLKPGELIVHDAYHRVLCPELVRRSWSDRRLIRTRDIFGPT
jgi:hypothetical protein